MTTSTAPIGQASARMTLASQAVIRARHHSDFELTLSNVTGLWQDAYDGHHGPWLAQVASNCTPQEVLDEALASHARTQRIAQAPRSGSRVVRVRRGARGVTHR